MTQYEARPEPAKKTVAVPAGAVIESVTPEPKMSWVDYDGRYLFYFEETEEQAIARVHRRFTRAVTRDEPSSKEIRIVYRLTDAKKAGWQR